MQTQTREYAEPQTDTTHALELALIAGMLWAPAMAVRAILQWLAPDDFETLGAREVHATISRLVHAGRAHGMHAVISELQRRGQLTQAAKMLVLDAGTLSIPPHPDSLRAYAAAVVGASYRRHTVLVGHTIAEVAATANENEIMPRMRALGVETARREQRLNALRDTTDTTPQETAA